MGAVPPAMGPPASVSDPLTDDLCSFCLFFFLFFFPADLQAASLREVLGPDAAAQSYLHALARSLRHLLPSHSVTSTQTSSSIHPATPTFTHP